MSYTYPLDQFRDLWEAEPLVVIDTNGFLNLYRFSPETSNHILDVLNTIPKSQFWLPAQVLYEFNENQKDVITREHNKYKEVTKEIERIMLIASNDISKQFIRFNKFRFPRVKELGVKINDAFSTINTLSEDYKEEIKEEVKKNENMLKEDKVKSFVDGLINEGCVGTEFNITSLLHIFSEGEQRYKYKIPPGYMDEVKDKKDVTKRKKFGDLILWKQVLEQARLRQKPIIFITQDEKEDWWVLDKEKNPVRPRNELLSEFSEYSEHPLVILSMNNFVNHISVINDINDFTSNLEMNADSICTNLIEKHGWDVTIDNNGNLTSYLIHSGDLQDFLENPLQDIEITDFNKPELSIYTVDFDDDEVVIEGTFETQVETNIIESYSKNYSKDFSALVHITGSISLEFNVDFEKQEDFIKMETLNIIVGGFEVTDCISEEDYEEFYEECCVNCGNPNTSYFTKSGDPVCQRCIRHYETCPDCGKLFEQGSLGGAFCSSCASEH